MCKNETLHNLEDILYTSHCRNYKKFCCSSGVKYYVEQTIQKCSFTNVFRAQIRQVLFPILFAPDKQQPSLQLVKM